MILGFIGTGSITEAVVTGIVRAQLDVGQLLVSPRNASVAGRLAERFSIVSIARSNQEVVERSEMVFLAVRPQIAEGVVRSLRFMANQRVVSLIATVSTETLRSWIETPVRIIQAVPLPFVAEGLGATTVYPPDAQVAAIFARLGVAFEVQTRAEFELLSAASAMMGTYFGILETGTRWMESKGMPYQDARMYMAQLAAGLSQATMSSGCKSFDDLRYEFSTKGGINEHLYEVFHSRGGSTALLEAMDTVLHRIQGATDDPGSSSERG